MLARLLRRAISRYLYHRAPLRDVEIVALDILSSDVTLPEDHAERIAARAAGAIWTYADGVMSRSDLRRALRVLLRANTGPLIKRG